MKIFSTPQKLEDGSTNPEWLALRIGLPTASKFEKIISPTGEKSKQWETYAHEILAEEVVGHAIEGYISADMQEGQRREAESVAFYEFNRNVTTQPVGFVTDDARTCGCSPDRLIGDDGLLELKNPKASTYIEYLLNPNKAARGYWPQLQGSLHVTRRKWLHFMPYFPEMPELIVEVEPDLPYLKLLDEMLGEFNAKLAAKRARLIEMGHIKPKTNDDPSRYLRAG